MDITYSLIGDLGMRLRGFNYVDRNSMTVVSAEIPLFYAINDFVVYNDCVYFCGYDSITPIYGFFDINDVFFNNGVINYYRITQNTISSLDIIKAKRTSSGDLHMVMIGKGTSALTHPRPQQQEEPNGYLLIMLTTTFPKSFPDSILVFNTIGNSTCQILTIVLIIQKATIPISLY